MILRADARALPLRASCVDCCVTSPPYFGLRDYGDVHQIGLEATLEAYIAAIVAVFREVGRVLKDNGTLWMNMGDSYATGTTAPRNPTTITGPLVPASWAGRSQPERCGTPIGFKTKDLLGIPWRVAFALQADGWYLRADVIWSKPNPMPESVTDRPTKAHEYVFLLAKSERYYYNAAAIAELAICGGDNAGYAGYDKRAAAMGRAPSGNEKPGMIALNKETRNRRSVWTVATEPYSGAHFATFPERLIEPCILAGCPEGGVVLDPFLGSGTVGAVAERFGRRWVGTDLTYQGLARERTAQRGLMFI